MTVIRPNSVTGINSITVQSGNSLAVHKANGELIRTLTSSSGVSTFSSISVGTAYTDNSAAKSINIGIGASISQHSDRSLTFGTAGDPRVSITQEGNLQIPADTVKLQIGASQDLYLWHNGSTGNSNISNVTGDLFIQGHNGSGTAVNSIAIKNNAGVELNYQASKKLETTSSGISITGDINVGTAATIKSNGNATFSGIVTATSFIGDGSGLSGVTATTINNNADNRVITGSGSANTLNGESNVVIDSNGNMGIGVAGHDPLTALHVQGTNAGALRDVFTVTNQNGTPGTAVGMVFECGTDEIARISAKNEGSDIGPLIFATASSQTANPSEKMRLTSDGYLRFAQNKGLQFSNQTASAVSGTSNQDTDEIINHYEFGDWTPTCTNTALASGGGHYMRIGALVWVGCNMTFASMSGSATVTLGGLPFTIGSNVFGGIMVKFSNFSNLGDIMGHLDAGTNGLHLPGTTLDEASGKRLDWSTVYPIYNF